LVVAYTNVADDRNAAGNPFPTVQIFDGPTQSIFLVQRFSTANLLDQKF
jgi:hypothetical protein